LKTLRTGSIIAWLGLFLATSAEPAHWDGKDVPRSLPGTTHFQLPDNILTIQHDQIVQYFLGEIAKTPALRDTTWQPAFSSEKAYLQSIEQHRRNLKAMLGLADVHPSRLESSSLILWEKGIRVEEIRLTVPPDLPAEALLFTPSGSGKRPVVIAIPPADQTREAFAGITEQGTVAPWLKSFLQRGVSVALPVMVERSHDHPWSELSWNSRMTRRQFLHRLAFPVGRTVVGLEVQQVCALREVLSRRGDVDGQRIGLIGIDQGGMTAFYSAAVDPGFVAVAVIDYFQRREDSWKEPVDRMLFGQLKEFGDAEVAALVAPRPLAILSTPGGTLDPEAVRVEFGRAKRFYSGLGQAKQLHLFSDANPLLDAAGWFSEAVQATTERKTETVDLRIPPQRVEDTRNEHFMALRAHLRRLIGESDQVRDDFWGLSKTPADGRAEKVSALRDELRRLMGSISTEEVPLNPRTSLIEVADRFAAYDVLMDVLPGVEAWGQLLIPKGADGRTPIVIAQHGGSGKPCDVTGVTQQKPSVYHWFARRLAEEGYVVFAPLIAVANQPFPKARDRREELFLGITEAMNPKVRMAASLGMMRTSIEQAKLSRIVDFLQSLPFADGEKIGYYGLSYGGYAATWMSPLEERLKAVVISGHFNDWLPKITSERIATSYLRHPDEDFANWRVLHRFTHRELLAAVWPRAVCVEYGERDAVTPPGWLRRAWQGVSEHAEQWESTEILTLDYFDGGHEIHGVGSFDFLRRFLHPDKTAQRDYASRDMSGLWEKPEEQLFVSHQLDTSGASRVAGRFHVTSSSPMFSGMAFRISRSGSPGDLMVRFGSCEEAGDIGQVRIPVDSIPKGGDGRDDWIRAQLKPVRLEPGRSYYFELTAEWGWKDRGDFYTVYGPRPLGGKTIDPYFNASFKVLSD